MTQPTSPLPPDDETKQAYVNAQMRSAQTLITVSMIAAPVSLIWGGVLLSLVALICSLVALSKLKHIPSAQATKGTLARSLINQCILTIVFSSIALVLNAISFAIVFSTVMSALQSGDYDLLVNLLEGGEGSSSSSGQSAPSLWD